MRTIDLETWPRRNHFRLFNGFDYPHISLCAPVDVTRLARRSHKRDASFTVAMMYALSRTANGIAPFRWRIRGESVVEHDTIHPSSTVMGEEGLFGFCTVPFTTDFRCFAADAAVRIQQARSCPSLEDEEGRDDYIYMTAIPWVSFTAMTHPIHMNPVDSVPRMAWGRMTVTDQRVTMPLSVQVHHALMDGVHLGHFFQRLQQHLDDDAWLSTTGRVPQA